MFFNILKHTLKNIVRNKFITFSSILIIGLLVLFINILVIIHDVSFKIIENLNDKISINLYLKDGINKKSKEYNDFLKDIKDISSKINIKYKTKEDINTFFKKEEPELSKIVSKANNPFPNSIFISNININDYDKINTVIEPKTKGNNAIFEVNMKKINDEVNGYKIEFEKINKLIKTFKIIIFLLYIFIFVFVLSIFIIIYSIIGNFIFHYRDEISITKLIGGSKRFIYGPFTLQGIIYATLAFLVSLASLYFLINFLPDIFKFFQTPFDYDMSIFYPTFKKILPIELLVLIFIGGLSGLLSTRKYSKEIKN